MFRNIVKKTVLWGLVFMTAFSSFYINPAAVFAEPEQSQEIDPYDYYGLAEARKALPIQSNEIPNWPQGPEIGAEGAILMEANTGTILYAKNIDEKLYPASTTKILTSLVAIENSEMDEMVKFSHEAVFSIERGSSNMGMDEGQSIPMEQCLYGILVYSANEVCNAVAEHISGSMDAYVELMNQKAAELGCTNSHFVTTNGLHDENHYTTPRDLATIACAFFSNPILSRISGTAYYHVPQSPTQPDDDVDLYTHNLLTKKTYEYDGYIGGKTGYTTISRQTLVSCAERDGLKLVCVIMKEESPNQFLDTMALFDYGFQNFQYMNVAENEINYTVNESSLFHSEEDIFFNSRPITEVDPDAYVIMPNTVSFEDLSSSLSYDNAQTTDSILATIDYTYQDIYLGSADISITPEDSDKAFSSDMSTVVSPNHSGNENIIFINVIYVVAGIVVLFLVIITVIGIIASIRDYHFSHKKRGPSLIRRKRGRKNSDMWDSWN